MSHKITVQGHFGSADSLKDELNDRGIAFSESKEGGDTVLTFSDRKFNRYGNALKLNLDNPSASSMDSDIAYVVGEWYRNSMARHVRYNLAMQGHTVLSEVTERGEIVLQVAVG